jgi:hypothetical protein
MKSIIALLILTLTLWTVSSVGQTQISEDDPQWRQQTVRRAFDEVSAGMYYSWTEKWLARLGDSAAPEIMNLLATKNLSKKDAQTTLSLVKMSFAYPRLITHNQNRTPTNALVLLDYLDKHTSDANIKSNINSMRKQLHVSQSGTAPKG